MPDVRLHAIADALKPYIEQMRAFAAITRVEQHASERPLFLGDVVDEFVWLEVEGVGYFADHVKGRALNPALDDADGVPMKVCLFR